MPDNRVHDVTAMTDSELERACGHLPAGMLVPLSPFGRALTDQLIAPAIPPAAGQARPCRRRPRPG